MYIDLIRYNLAAGITSDMLRDAAENILESWMKKQPGFIRWEITCIEEGKPCLDLVYWKDQASAEAATKNMGQIPPDHPWLACYDMTSITSEKTSQLFVFNA